MPVAVTNAAPSGTFPHHLALQAARERGFTVRVATYADGATQRMNLGSTSRSKVSLSLRLTPAEADTFDAFWDAHSGPHVPFYYYQPEETSPAFTPTPSGGTGRYIYRFDGKKSVTFVGNKALVDFALVQLT